jgi:hypothetical protein
LEPGAWIKLKGEDALCLSCADIDHLVFLPTGDAALTRRARKASTLSAVVLKWSRSRKRYERQGLLLEEPALALAETQCLGDEEVRARRREREGERRTKLDRDFVDRFARRIREIFPKCPANIELAISERACLRSSGRVGRTAAGKAFDETAVRLAVIAHIRHSETAYDKLLAAGVDRLEARAQVDADVRAVAASWQG